MEEKKIFIACSDDMHALQLTTHVWGAPVAPQVELGATVLSVPSGGRPSIRYRLGVAWEAFKSSQPYTEYVFFDGPEEVAKVRDMAQKALDHYEEVTGG